MAKLPEEVKRAMDAQDAFPFATCSKDLVPNVIYLTYLKAVDDETVLVADNYLDKTLHNLEENPKACFVVLDKEKGSYQVKGPIERKTSGPLYDEVQTWVDAKHPRKAAVILHVQEVYNGAKRIV
jgi:predicted pyridoxine 5'-phosphate oxidase superfamily flavin-nucleotide-binding protein